jgi:hypothetical protein
VLKERNGLYCIIAITIRYVLALSHNTSKLRRKVIASENLALEIVIALSSEA